MIKAIRPHRVAFVTLGCPKNEVDSDIMKNDLLCHGYDVIDDISLAEAIIVNTCAFITDASQQSVETILELLDIDTSEKAPMIIVCGCLPSRYGDSLRAEIPEVAAFIPADNESSIAQVLDALFTRKCRKTEAGEVLRSRGTYSSYVKISDGCDRFCSYCTIPHIRGRYHSFPLEKILEEVAYLVDGGCKEIILIGQDTGLWGSDFPVPSNTAALLDRLAQSFPQTWFRLMYLQPEGISDELLDCFAKHENICHYLDIPLQHASAKVIKEMNRRGSSATYLETLGRIRKAMPDAAIRTTFICGFPGESRADSLQLKKFIEDASFDYAGVFVYSQEDITLAGKRDDQVPLRTRKARAQRLRDLADSISFAKNQQRLGTVLPVLVEGYETDGEVEELVGRSMYMAPEIDGQVHLPLGSAQPGDIVQVRLIDSFCYEFEGELA